MLKHIVYMKVAKLKFVLMKIQLNKASKELELLELAIMFGVML